jgi:hypothetical protein
MLKSKAVQFVEAQNFFVFIAARGYAKEIAMKICARDSFSCDSLEFKWLDYEIERLMSSFKSNLILAFPSAPGYQELVMDDMKKAIKRNVERMDEEEDE